jgi:general secretion pathway protein K
MALVAVLWIIAALSILVTGLIWTTRAQISTVAARRDAAAGQALGDAAITLTLQALLVSNPKPTGVQTVPVTYAGQTMQVEVAPLNGLISLNSAGAPMLAALLQGAGGLPPPAAQDLAQQLVQWRSEAPQTSLTNGPGQPRLFEAPEDLLLVPGVDYDLYSRLAPLVSADLRGGRINPQAAPSQVLAALAPGNQGMIAQFLAQRGQPGADSSFLDSGFISNVAFSGQLFRLRVSVPLDAGKMLVLTRDVALRGTSSSLLPWRLLRQSRQIQSSGAT